MLQIRKQIYFSLFVLIYPPCLFAQQPLNLSFEKKSVEGSSRPWGWDLNTWGATTFRMDSIVVKNGRYSLNSVCNDEQNRGAAQLRFIIEAYELKNKKITLSGSIQTAALNGSAHFSLGYVFLDLKEDKYIEFDTSSANVSGNSGWKTFSVYLAVPANAQSVYVAVNHTGVGKAWFDDLKLSSGGKILNAVMVAKPFSKENINWLNKNSFPIQSVVPDNKNDDLLPFKNAVGNNRLVALGESTHGTSEFFSLKNRLLQYAVTTLGFRVFAIEDNQLVAEKVNKYVLGGEVTIKESMSGMFAVWYTEEVIAMIEWIRNYNDQHVNDKVSFVGFDMQEINRPIDSLFSFLKRQDDELYQKAMTSLKDLKENGSKSYSVTDSIKLTWFNAAAGILNDVKQRSRQWYSKTTDSFYITLGIQYANLVRQFAENTSKGHWSLYRDEAMAENVSWLAEKRFPTNKILIWAHDVHISRCDHPDEHQNLNNSISMGSFLSKKYGTGYKSFSLSSYTGQYLAFKSYTDFTRVNAPLFPAPVGSLDEALHRIVMQKSAIAVFLPLPRNEGWLSDAAPKRFANHVNIDYGFWERISIPYQYDGIFFIDKTSASKYIQK